MDDPAAYPRDYAAGGVDIFILAEQIIVLPFTEVIYGLSMHIAHHPRPNIPKTSIIMTQQTPQPEIMDLEANPPACAPRIRYTLMKMHAPSVHWLYADKNECKMDCRVPPPTHTRYHHV